MQSDVVMIGYRLNAKEPAAKALERILGLTPEAARQLARQFPVVVVQGASEAHAAEVAHALETAGALVELRSHAAEGSEHLPANDTSLAAGAALPVAQEASASGSYQLGDFGLEPPSPPRAEPAAATAPAERAAEQVASGLPLELAGLPSAAPLELESLPGTRTRTQKEAPDPDAGSGLHTLGDGFEDLDPALKAPELEERAYRAIQRAPKPSISRRPAPMPLVKRSARARAAIARSLRSWAPSVLALVLLTLGSALAVGYALDPGDPVGALVRETAAPAHAFEEPPPRRDDMLHPLLQATPHAARPALAAIMRSHMAGVHDVPVSFPHGSEQAQCSLVEHAEGLTESRLAGVRATGHPVAPTPEALVQLEAHERALRRALGRPTLQLTAVCLLP